MKCPRCHEEQPDGTKFCMSCGARFSYEPKRSAAPVEPEAAFAPTLATELPTKPGTPTPGVLPQAPMAAASTMPGPAQPLVPPSIGTTPPPFSTGTPSGGVMPPAPVGVVITPAGGTAAAAPAMARPSTPSTTPPRAVAASVAAAAPVEDRSIVVATVSGKLTGLDVHTGAVVWEHAIDNGTPQLLIGQGLVLAAVGQSLYCCDYKTGRPMWRAALSAYSPRITMILEGDHVYAFGAGVVDAFDRIGRRLWTHTILAGAAASGAIGVPGNVSQADRD